MDRSRQLNAPDRGSGLGAELRRSLDGLQDRDRRIVEARIGVYGGVRTLEEIGATLGLTRERVRQLESAAFSRIASQELWPAKLMASLDQALKSRTEPLWLALLPTLDPFFEDYALSETVLARLIEAFSNGRFHCFPIEGLLVCSSATQEQFDNQRQAFHAFAKGMVQQKPTKFELEVFAESFAANCSARELRGAIFRSVEPNLQFARLPGSTEAVLVAFGRGVEHVALAVLQESEEPLHYKEIHRRTVARLGTDVDIRRVHSALRQPGIFLFGRGTFGLRRHLNATEQEVSDVRDLAEEIVLAGDPNRQWHTHEILESLPFEATLRGVEITPYTLDLALTGSQRLRCLGRMVWVAASSTHKGSADRIDITQACMALLREAGRPLKRSELVGLLKDWRGVGKHFQLHRNSDVVAIAPGVWGLRERDLPVSNEEIGILLDSLFRVLSERGTGLHQSEMIEMCRGAGVPFFERVDPYWMLSLAGSDSRFRVFYGGYVGLATWNTSRRLSLVGSAKAIASECKKSMPIEFFAHRISEISGREVSRGDTASALREAGFAFDSSNGCWNPPTEEGAEDAVEE